MAIRHGQKIYYQVLVDPNRAELIEDLAKKGDMRATAWIRQAIYSELKRVTSTVIYNEATAKDQAQWQSSIRNRVEGRNKPEEKTFLPKK
tara:strand:- start:749 stop:1018 length:270 start_codon:yes stop_codon:yes gene_type:complete